MSSSIPEVVVVVGIVATVVVAPNPNNVPFAHNKIIIIIIIIIIIHIIINIIRLYMCSLPLVQVISTVFVGITLA